jgi:predicted PurR-regulated permease PerM
LGLLAGLAQFVPVIGPLIAAGPGILLAFSVSPETALWTGVVYLAASQIEANLIFPLIQKRAVSLPPALTLFAIIAMGALFGPLGVLLALPVTIILTVFVIRFYVNRTLGEDVPAPGASMKRQHREDGGEQG